MNRRQFMATAPAALLPALAPMSWAEPASKQVFWNLEEFESRVNFRSGELALVLGGSYEVNTFLWHAVVSNSLVMPTVLIDCRTSITCEEVTALQKVFDHKVKVLHGDRMFWPFLLHNIQPGSAVFVGTEARLETDAAYGWTREEMLSISMVARDRNLALVFGRDIGPNAYWVCEPEPEQIRLQVPERVRLQSQSLQSVDLVLAVERQPSWCRRLAHIVVSIVKNRNGTNDRLAFWYNDLGYDMDRHCGAWC